MPSYSKRYTILDAEAHLRALATETTCKLDILGLCSVPSAIFEYERLEERRTDGDTLRVDGAQVGVLEERDEVSFDRLLERTDGR